MSAFRRPNARNLNADDPLCYRTNGYGLQPRYGVSSRLFSRQAESSSKVPIFKRSSSPARQVPFNIPSKTQTITTGPIRGYQTPSGSTGIYNQQRRGQHCYAANSKPQNASIYPQKRDLSYAVPSEAQVNVQTQQKFRNPLKSGEKKSFKKYLDFLSSDSDSSSSYSSDFEPTQYKPRGKNAGCERKTARLTRREIEKLLNESDSSHSSDSFDEFDYKERKGKTAAPKKSVIPILYSSSDDEYQSSDETDDDDLLKNFAEKQRKFSLRTRKSMDVESSGADAKIYHAKPKHAKLYEDSSDSSDSVPQKQWYSMKFEELSNSSSEIPMKRKQTSSNKKQCPPELQKYKRMFDSSTSNESSSAFYPIHSEHQRKGTKESEISDSYEDLPIKNNHKQRPRDSSSEQQKRRKSHARKHCYSSATDDFSASISSNSYTNKGCVRKTQESSSFVQFLTENQKSKKFCSISGSSSFLSADEYPNTSSEASSQMAMIPQSSKKQEIVIPKQLQTDSGDDESLADELIRRATERINNAMQKNKKDNSSQKNKTEKRSSDDEEFSSSLSDEQIVPPRKTEQKSKSSPKINFLEEESNTTEIETITKEPKRDEKKSENGRKDIVETNKYSSYISEITKDKPNPRMKSNEDNPEKGSSSSAKKTPELESISDFVSSPNDENNETQEDENSNIDAKLNTSLKGVKKLSFSDIDEEAEDEDDHILNTEDEEFIQKAKSKYSPSKTVQHIGEDVVIEKDSDKDEIHFNTFQPRDSKSISDNSSDENAKGKGELNHSGDEIRQQYNNLIGSIMHDDSDDESLDQKHDIEEEEEEEEIPIINEDSKKSYNAKISVPVMQMEEEEEEEALQMDISTKLIYEHKIEIEEEEEEESGNENDNLSAHHIPILTDKDIQQILASDSEEENQGEDEFNSAQSKPKAYAAEYKNPGNSLVENMIEEEDDDDDELLRKYLKIARTNSDSDDKPENLTASKSQQINIDINDEELLKSNSGTEEESEIKATTADLQKQTKEEKRGNYMNFNNNQLNREDNDENDDEGDDDDINFDFRAELEKLNLTDGEDEDEDDEL